MKSIFKKLWLFILKSLYITGLLRIIRLRRKLKKSSRGRLNINQLEKLTADEDIKHEMRAFIKLFLQCEN